MTAETPDPGRCVLCGFALDANRREYAEGGFCADVAGCRRRALAIVRRLESDQRQRRPVAFAPSLVRLGLDALLRLHPHLDVLRVEWERGDDANPWVLVDLGQRSAGDVEAFAVWKFAVWKATGAVHAIDHQGAASDDPIVRP